MTKRPIDPETGSWYSNEKLHKIIAENQYYKRQFRFIRNSLYGIDMNPLPNDDPSKEIPIMGPQKQYTVHKLQDLPISKNLMRKFALWIVVLTMIAIAWTHEGPPLWQQVTDLFMQFMAIGCPSGGS